MRTIFAKAGILTILANPVLSETVLCETTQVSVNTPGAKYAETICEAAEQAKMLFERCGVPSLSRPVRIEIVDELEGGCAARYHCDNDWIEVLAPPSMQTGRDSDSAFAHLQIEEYFQSVVVHELAHAALDDVPCPFEACISADEYVAYTMQVMSLKPEAQMAFAEKAGLDRPISRGELSSIMLFMAPDRFAQKAWTHFTQRDDPCGFIGQITDGTVLLDRERF